MKPLTRGRSKNSHLVVAWSNVHLFLWSPWHGSDSFGVTARWRQREDNWQHLRLILFQRNKLDLHRKVKSRNGQFRVRRTLTVAELSWWRTEGGVRDRVDLKGYLRLKMSTGGRPL